MSIRGPINPLVEMIIIVVVVVVVAIVVVIVVFVVLFLHVLDTTRWALALSSANLY